MAENVFRKNFANFKGLDNRSNDLVRPAECALSMKNFEIAYDGSLRLRRGERIICTDNGDSQAANGLMRYVRLSPITGATEERLFGADSYDHLLRELKTDGFFSLNYTGAGAATFSFYPVAGNYRAILKVAGSTILDYNCGDGGILGSFITLEQLAANINTKAGWSAKITPRGLAANTGGPYGLATASPLVLQAGHTVRLGDTVKIGTAYRKITRVSGNNIWWTVDAGLNTAEEDIIGISHYGAVGLPSAADVAIGSTYVDFPVYYWGLLTHPAGCFPFHDSWANSHGMTPFTEVNIGNSAYIFGSYSSLGKGRIWKFDGNGVYGAGIFNPYFAATSFALTAGGFLTINSTYKYAIIASFIDYNGTIIESDPDIPDDTAKSVGTTSAGNRSFNLDIRLNNFIAARGGACGNAYIAAAQINLTTGVAVSSGHTMKPGDRAKIIDVSTGVPLLVERVLTAVDDTNLYWDTAAAINVTNTPAPLQTISNGLTWSLLRTKANGQNFYLVGEYPLAATGGTTPVVFSDGLADVGLGAQYIRPEAGREHTPPPSMLFGCEHQGLLVGANIPVTSPIYAEAQPNTIAFSLPEGPEYFPVAYNSVDIPSGVVGPITAIASNGASALMVAKENARYNVLGELDSYAFTIERAAEFTEGCPAHDAIQLLWSSLIFPSRQGIITSTAGKGDSNIGLPVLRDFMQNNNFSFYISVVADPIPPANEAKIFFRGARTYVDSVNQQVWFYLPCLSLDVAGTFVRPNANSKLYVLDLKSEAWYNWSFSDPGLQPFSGIRSLNGELFWAGRSVQRFQGGPLLKRADFNSDYDYVSNGVALDGDFQLQWEALGDPSVYKDFLRLKLIRIDDALTPFTLRVQTYLDYDRVTVDTDAYKSFTAANPRELDLKLAHSKCRAVMLRLRNMAAGVNVPSKPMVITGLEWTTTVPYRKEDAAI